jgi:hypothetical protein
MISPENIQLFPEPRAAANRICPENMALPEYFHIAVREVGKSIFPVSVICPIYAGLTNDHFLFFT